MLLVDQYLRRAATHRVGKWTCVRSRPGVEPHHHQRVERPVDPFDHQERVIPPPSNELRLARQLFRQEVSPRPVRVLHPDLVSTRAQCPLACRCYLGRHLFTEPPVVRTAAGRLIPGHRSGHPLDVRTDVDLHPGSLHSVSRGEHLAFRVRRGPRPVHFHHLAFRVLRRAPFFAALVGWLRCRPVRSARNAMSSRTISRGSPAPLAGSSGRGGGSTVTQGAV